MAVPTAHQAYVPIGVEATVPPTSSNVRTMSHTNTKGTSDISPLRPEAMSANGNSTRRPPI